MRVRDPEGRVRSNPPGRLDGLRAEITRLARYLGERVGERDDWSNIKLLTVAVDRLRLGNSGQKRRPAELGEFIRPWTRIRRDNIAFPFVENDQPLFEIVDTIVSEGL
jgi:hypothetical protein